MTTRRGKHEGTMHQRPNGSWRAQVSIDGKRIGYTSRSRAEVHEWLRKMLDGIDQGMTFQGRNLTLREYLDEWITLKKTRLRPKTAFQYQLLIDKYIKPLLGMKRLRDLNVRVVNQFYEQLLQKTVGLSQIAHVHRVLHAALEQAVKNGTLIRNPAHGAIVPKGEHREMQILNEQQVGLFLVAASNSRYRSLYQLAITTGMRVSELRGLSWTDVDWVKSSISVKRQIQEVPRVGMTTGAPKTHAGTRTVLLGEATLSELRAQKQRVDAKKAKLGSSWNKDDLIFPSRQGTPFSKFKLQRDFASVLEAANLPKIRFHDLRHTAASLMLAHGIPPLVVSKMLGHANPSTTLMIYAHSDITMQSDAARTMDAIVTPVPVELPVKDRVTADPEG
ncbi:MAG TPA: site-specific integrase [Anaerolineales bacterium]